MRARARRIQLDGDARLDESPSARRDRRSPRRVRAARCPSRAETPAARRAPARSPSCPPARAARRARRCAPPARRAAASPSCRSSPSGRTLRDAAIASACPVVGGVEAEQAADRRRGANRAERGRAVPAALVVARIHQAAEPRLDLETDDVGVEHGRAREACATSRRRQRPPAPAARSDARATRSTCRRSRARARRCRWRAPRRRCAARTVRAEHGARVTARRRSRRRGRCGSPAPPRPRASRRWCRAPPPPRVPARPPAVRRARRIRRDAWSLATVARHVAVPPCVAASGRRSPP